MLVNTSICGTSRAFTGPRRAAPWSILILIVMGCNSTSKEHERCDNISLEVQRTCAEGLVCNTLLDPPTCVTPVASGAACDPSAGMCAEELLCNTPSTNAAPRCEAPGSRQDGEACLLDEACAEGLICYPSSTCRPLRSGQREEICGRDDDSECTEGLVCVKEFIAATGYCLPPGQLDAGCYEEDDCEAGFICVDSPNRATETPVCANLGAEGSDCGQDEDCTSGLICDVEMYRCL